MSKVEFANEYLENIARLATSINLDEIKGTLKIVEKTHQKGRNIFIIGNGGSASTASHMACDLNKTTLKYTPQSKERFRTYSLTDNIPSITAHSNDEGYDVIFSEQLKNLAVKKDLLIVITGSGNSTNIIMAVETAKQIGMRTIGFLGFKGGRVKEMLDSYILIPSNEYGPIEDYHLILDHLFTEYFANKISRQNKSS